MKRKLYLVILNLVIVCFISCNDNTHKEFYSNGRPKIVYSVDAKGRKHGIYREYYESGELKLEINYKGGQKDGRFLEYYENGNLKRYLKYHQDSLVSTDLSFWQDGVLKEIHSFKEKEIKTSIYYNYSGQIDKLIVWADKFYAADENNRYKSTYIKFDQDEYINVFRSLIPTVSSYKDTISINEKYQLAVGVTSTFMSDKSFYILTGDFNDNFVIKDSSSINKIYPATGDNALTLQISPNKKGMNTFRCIICNYSVEEDNEIKTRYTPVVKTYYVK